MKAFKIVKYLLVLVIVGALVFAGIKLYNVVQKEFFLPLKYEVLVEQYARESDLPPALVYAVIRAESSFLVTATSPAGARGLMQLMPSTYEWLCGQTGEEYEPEKLYTPETNLRYGCLYLGQQLRRFGDVRTALAAYNAGPQRVLDWLADPEISPGGVLGSIPFPETDSYVEKVQKSAREYEKLYLQEKGWKSYE